MKTRYFNLWVLKWKSRIMFYVCSGTKGSVSLFHRKYVVKYSSLSRKLNQLKPSFFFGECFLKKQLVVHYVYSCRMSLQPTMTVMKSRRRFAVFTVASLTFPWLTFSPAACHLRADWNTRYSPHKISCVCVYVCVLYVVMFSLFFMSHFLSSTFFLVVFCLITS